MCACACVRACACGVVVLVGAGDLHVSWQMCLGVIFCIDLITLNSDELATYKLLPQTLDTNTVG